jgi:assimilatory nitrate reductase catalytic subunit
MAKLSTDIPDLVEAFGPSLNRVPPGGWADTREDDRLVKTHCCFCGQQCGIQLRVRENKIVGFEPWEDFPFNRGKLCPKGIKRYMQDEHPDRLKSPLERVNGLGFVPVGWDAALDRVVSEIKRIQETYGKDSFAVLTGASMTNEKAYLMGKFARVALQTANIDYNGRLCMVSAGTASKKVFGIDRSGNPWSDIVAADVILVAGANIAECAPITTDYIWRAKDRGAKLIVIDPRMTPIARNADLFIPVRPGGDIGIFNGMLHIMIKRGWIDQEYIAKNTIGFEEVAHTVEKYTPEYSAKIAGVPVSMIVRAAELFGPAKTSFVMHARGIEHHSKGVENCIAMMSLALASGRLGREGCGYAMITGQGNGQGAREQGGKCDQLPGNRKIDDPEARKYIAGVWDVPEESIPGKGLSAIPLVEAIHAGKIKGLISICFNPVVSLPDANFTREALGKLEFYTNIDFFLSETAQHADIVLPGSLMEEDEGTTTNVEGRVIRHRKVVSPPQGAWEDWKILCELARRLGKGDKFDYEGPREIFDELRVASKGSVSDYYGMTWDRIEENNGIFWPCPTSDHPGTPRLYEDGKFGHADGKAHFIPVEWRPSVEVVDEEYPVILTTGRVVSQFLSGTQTRRIGALIDQVPEPFCEMHPQLATRLGVIDDDYVKVESRRGHVIVHAKVVKTIRPDTVFVPYHWPHDRSANNMTIRALDPQSEIPEFKICAVRITKTQRPTDPIAELEVQAGGIR